jgi:DNA-binding MarR family transcriptional regulator
MGVLAIENLHLWKLLRTLQKLEEQVAGQLSATDEPRNCADEMKFRERRNALFPVGYFTDPAWDILLDLYSAHCAGRSISTTGLGLAGGVPQTTMLRHLGQLVGDGLAIRVNDPLDRRRVFVELTELGVKRMATLFGETPPRDTAALYSTADALEELVLGRMTDMFPAAEDLGSADPQREGKGK